LNIGGHANPSGARWVRALTAALLLPQVPLFLQWPDLRGVVRPASEAESVVMTAKIYSSGRRGRR
jgi:hypothetical protein